MHVNKVSIRVASTADAERVTRLLERSYPVLMATDYAADVLAAALPLMTRANPLLLASGTYYVAEAPDGMVVGCGGWTPQQPGTGAVEEATGHVRHFATDPQWLRRGVGRALIERSIGVAQAAGMRRLDCFSSLNAVPFYAASGFSTVRLLEVPLSAAVRLPSALMRQAL